MRVCGECTLCCTVTRVPELRKAEGYACTHCTDKGCSIYDERPASCRRFRCRWLEGDMPEALRPDKLHVVVEALPDVPVYLALVEPGFVITAGITKLLNEYINDGIAVVSGRQVLLPDGVTENEVISDINKAVSTMRAM